MTAFDLLIRGATVYPGDAASFEGDVGVTNGAISLVTLWHKDSTPPDAREVVDGHGLMLCPGFIDLHTHSALRSFEDPLLTPKLAQGFTLSLIHI